jgi:hypothetical protein
MMPQLKHFGILQVATKTSKFTNDMNCCYIAVEAEIAVLLYSPLRTNYILFNIYMSTTAYSIYWQLFSIPGGHSFICNLRRHHAVVTGTVNH